MPHLPEEYTERHNTRLVLSFGENTAETKKPSTQFELPASPIFIRGEFFSHVHEGLNEHGLVEARKREKGAMGMARHTSIGGRREGHDGNCRLLRDARLFPAPCDSSRGRGCPVGLRKRPKQDS